MTALAHHPTPFNTTTNNQPANLFDTANQQPTTVEMTTTTMMTMTTTTTTTMTTTMTMTMMTMMTMMLTTTMTTTTMMAMTTTTTTMMTTTTMTMTTVTTMTMMTEKKEDWKGKGLFVMLPLKSHHKPPATGAQ